MPIQTVYVLSQDDAESRSWLSFFRRHGASSLSSLTIERVYWLEGSFNLDRLMLLLVNPLYQTASPHSHLESSLGPIVEVAYRPGGAHMAAVAMCANYGIRSKPCPTA